MATLSLPTNTPAIDGAVIGCTTDDTNGTAYAMVRTGRQWYSVANGDSQALVDADKATIIAQDITASELVWAGTDTDLADIELIVEGLSEDSGPFYVGLVQEEATLPAPEFESVFDGSITGWTLTRAGSQHAIKNGDYVKYAADNAPAYTDSGVLIECESYQSLANTSDLSVGEFVDGGTTDHSGAYSVFTPAADSYHYTRLGLGAHAYNLPYVTEAWISVVGTANPAPYILLCGQSSNNGFVVTIDTATGSITEQIAIGTGTLLNATTVVHGDWIQIIAIGHQAGNGFVHLGTSNNGTPGTYLPNHSEEYTFNFKHKSAVSDPATSFAIAIGSSLVETTGTVRTQPAVDFTRSHAFAANDITAQIVCALPFGGDWEKWQDLNVLKMDDGTTSNVLSIDCDQTTNAIVLTKTVGGVSKTATVGFAYNYNQELNIRLRCSSVDGLSMWINSETVNTDATATDDWVSLLSGIQVVNGHGAVDLRKMVVWHESLTDAQIEALT